VVAEGVETRELWERVAEFGCDRVQGYFVSRPAAAEDVARRLKESGMRFQPGREAA
jgi:EAL domain-containing protein (putative c-di-GMP-specific phosphodiesterase class I)